MLRTSEIIIRKGSLLPLLNPTNLSYLWDILNAFVLACPVNIPIPYERPKRTIQKLYLQALSELKIRQLTHHQLANHRFWPTVQGENAFWQWAIGQSTPNRKSIVQSMVQHSQTSHILPSKATCRGSKWCSRFSRKWNMSLCKICPKKIFNVLLYLCQNQPLWLHP